MAKISIKNKKRYRVQISISKGLWEKYNANLEIAKQLGAEIDFSKDFEAWFMKQNEQVHQELNLLIQAESSAPEAPQLTAIVETSSGAEVPETDENGEQVESSIPAFIQWGGEASRGVNYGDN